jgi:hypothetical protein
MFGAGASQTNMLLYSITQQRLAREGCAAYQQVTVSVRQASAGLQQGAILKASGSG